MTFNRLVPFLIIALALCLPISSYGALIVGVTADNTLIEFDSADPSDLLSGLPITGLQPNETIRGIDFRPSTQELIGVGSLGRAYEIDRATGAATLVRIFHAGVAGNPLNGSAFGVDFNPVADWAGSGSLRIVSNTDQNLVVNLNMALNNTTVATPVAYPGGIPNPNIVGVAYTNSFTSDNPGPPIIPGTMQYVIDSGTDGLVLQAFNAGTLTPVGPLGFTTTANVGFDILTTPDGTNTAFATLQTGLTSRLYQINLLTGAATDLGEIDGGVVVPHMAAVPVPIPIPEPTTMGLLVVAGLWIVRSTSHVRGRR
jgi:hypothetical protein